MSNVDLVFPGYISTSSTGKDTLLASKADWTMGSHDRVTPGKNIIIPFELSNKINNLTLRLTRLFFQLELRCLVNPFSARVGIVHINIMNSVKFSFHPDHRHHGNSFNAKQLDNF